MNSFAVDRCEWVGLARLDLRSHTLCMFARAVRPLPCRVMAPRVLRRSIQMTITPAPREFEEVIFIETGVGTDQHGSDVTKASVRAVKDAISWNSIPSLERLVPGGNDNVKLKLELAVPFDDGIPPSLDMAEVEACFAYGTLLKPVSIIHGGARFNSMCSVEALGDQPGNASWVVAVACVTVGF